MNTMQEQQVALVTGASSGIGKATASAFARLGWHVIGTGRTPARCEEAEAEIRAVAAPGARIDFLRGDFCEMAGVVRIARETEGLTDRINVLINNAGGVRDQRYLSSDGIEATMAANHFAAFLLTRELMPLLRAAATNSGGARVLAVASSAHEMCEGMRFGDLNWDADYAASAIYCQAKLANILFTRELNRRVEPDGIVAQAMHPGLVKSNFFNHGDEFMQQYGESKDGFTPEHSAETLVWMATAAETGAPGARYFHDQKECEAKPQATDDAAASRLWAETEAILQRLGY